MSKIRKQFSKRKIKVSKELISALEKIQISDEIIELIISIIEQAQEKKTKEKTSKELIFHLRAETPFEDMIDETYNRLDGLIERTENMKLRAKSINSELQKLAYFG